MTSHWNPGEVIAHRYVGHHDWITWCRPHIVVRDTPELLVLFQPEGTVIKRFDRHGNVPLASMTVRMNVLRLMYPGPGRCYSILLFFDAGTGVPPWYAKHFTWPDGDFKAWKIDIESPFQRTPLGVDTTDLVLDVIVQPDLRWHWKDEQSLARLVEHGIYTPAEAESFYEEGRRGIHAVENRLPPFCEPWPRWRPAPSWPIPQALPGWETFPGFDIDLHRRGPRVMRRMKEVK